MATDDTTYPYPLIQEKVYDNWDEAEQDEKLLHRSGWTYTSKVYDPKQNNITVTYMYRWAIENVH